MCRQTNVIWYSSVRDFGRVGRFHEWHLVLLLRAIAWASHQSVDRFNFLVPLGVEFAASSDIPDQ
jgi:hypothetical protein